MIMSKRIGWGAYEEKRRSDRKAVRKELPGRQT
jgi:hypothetical protein